MHHHDHIFRLAASGPGPSRTVAQAGPRAGPGMIRPSPDRPPPPAEPRRPGGRPAAVGVAVAGGPSRPAGHCASDAQPEAAEARAAAALSDAAASLAAWPGARRRGCVATGTVSSARSCHMHRIRDMNISELSLWQPRAAGPRPSHCTIMMIPPPATGDT